MAAAGQKQQGPRQALLAAIEDLIGQVFLHAAVPGQHVGQKTLGEFRLLAQQDSHASLRYAQQHAGIERGGPTHANELSTKTPFAEEGAGAQHADDRLFARRRHDCQRHAAFVDPEDGVGLGTLCEDESARSQPLGPRRETCRRQKAGHVELGGCARGRQWLTTAAWEGRGGGVNRVSVQETLLKACH